MFTTQVSPAGDQQWTVGRADWERLFAVAPGATAYLSPEWTECWLHEFGEALAPHQLNVRAPGGETVGCCLLTSRARWAGGLRLRRLYFNTSGERPADSVVIEHNRVLARPEYEGDVYRAVAAHLRASATDEIVFSGAEDRHVRLLCDAFSGWRAEVEWRDAPYVDLNALRAAGHTHLAVLSANTRAQVVRAIRRYEARAPLQVEIARTPAEAAAMLDQLIVLHEAHWQRRGEVGGFATPHRRSFHHAFARAGVVNGRARLLRVVNGDTVVGVVYSLAANGHVAFYQAGLLYEADPHLKPGLVTHHLAIDHYLADGCREYDFLPSAPGEGRYKTSLSNATRRLGTVTLSRPSWRNRYFDVLRAARRLSKRAMVSG